MRSTPSSSAERRDLHRRGGRRRRDQRPEHALPLRPLDPRTRALLVAGDDEDGGRVLAVHRHRAGAAAAVHGRGARRRRRQEDGDLVVVAVVAADPPRHRARGVVDLHVAHVARPHGHHRPRERLRADQRGDRVVAQRRRDHAPGGPGRDAVGPARRSAGVARRPESAASASSNTSSPRMLAMLTAASDRTSCRGGRLRGAPGRRRADPSPDAPAGRDGCMGPGRRSGASPRPLQRVAGPHEQTEGL